MKKIFFFAVLAAAFTFAACGSEETTEEQPQEDTVAVEPALVVDTMAVDTPVVEEPVEQVAKPQQKKAEATPKEEPKKIDPSQLKTNENTAAKKLNPADNQKGLKLSPNKPVRDNGNTVSSEGAAKAESAAGQDGIGTKKKGLTAK